jgi:hypothetical protein
MGRNGFRATLQDCLTNGGSWRDGAVLEPEVMTQPGHS